MKRIELFEFSRRRSFSLGEDSRVSCGHGKQFRELCKQIFAFSARKRRSLARRDDAQNSIARRAARAIARAIAAQKKCRLRFHTGKSRFFALRKDFLLRDSHCAISRVCCAPRAARADLRSKKFWKKMTSLRSQREFLQSRAVHCAFIATIARDVAKVRYDARESALCMFAMLSRAIRSHPGE
ncbi:MAG: hypothetical protein HY290_22585 [Planctomycetia bacterium]|nr:hypothetical protein [Planctomycetia bacterium]